MKSTMFLVVFLCWGTAVYAGNSPTNTDCSQVMQSQPSQAGNVSLRIHDPISFPVGSFLARQHAVDGETIIDDPNCIDQAGFFACFQSGEGNIHQCYQWYCASAVSFDRRLHSDLRHTRSIILPKKAERNNS